MSLKKARRGNRRNLTVCHSWSGSRVSPPAAANRGLVQQNDRGDGETGEKEQCDWGHETDHIWYEVSNRSPQRHPKRSEFLLHRGSRPQRLGQLFAQQITVALTEPVNGDTEGGRRKGRGPAWAAHAVQGTSG